eukprot:766417-Hanusia_phi.AAC.1
MGPESARPGGSDIQRFQVGRARPRAATAAVHTRHTQRHCDGPAESARRTQTVRSVGTSPRPG